MLTDIFAYRYLDQPIAFLLGSASSAASLISRSLRSIPFKPSLKLSKSRQLNLPKPHNLLCCVPVEPNAPPDREKLADLSFKSVKVPQVLRSAGDLFVRDK